MRRPGEHRDGRAATRGSRSTDAERRRRLGARRRRARRRDRSPSSGCLASIAGQTTKACRPVRELLGRARSRCATPPARLLGERHDEATRCPIGRPGSSAMVETSRSPNTVMATVRGIGVAVSTSTCGGRGALLPQGLALLDAEAVLLVDDDEPEVEERRRRRRAARACRRRCAPGRRRRRSSALRRSAARQLAGDAGSAGARPTRSGPSVRTIERRCCAASTSVGASSADCPPDSATASIARSATSVLPEPTSPCTRRFIGHVAARSPAISSPTTLLVAGEGERQVRVEALEVAAGARHPRPSWPTPGGWRAAAAAPPAARTPRGSAGCRGPACQSASVCGPVHQLERPARRASSPRSCAHGCGNGVADTGAGCRGRARSPSAICQLDRLARRRVDRDRRLAHACRRRGRSRR